MPEELSFRKKEPLSGLMTDLGLIPVVGRMLTCFIYSGNLNSTNGSSYAKVMPTMRFLASST